MTDLFCVSGTSPTEVPHTDCPAKALPDESFFPSNSDAAAAFPRFAQFLFFLWFVPGFSRAILRIILCRRSRQHFTEAMQAWEVEPRSAPSQSGASTPEARA
jgi:hypothetical protein